jgi:hypothetical protein
MCVLPKEQAVEAESAARKSKAAGCAIEKRKNAGLVTAEDGKVRKAANELAKEGVRVAGAKKAATKRYTRRSSKDGAEMLKQASDQALVEITGDVVSKLKEEAKKGDVVCMKTLMSWSEKKKPKEKPKRGLDHNMRLIEELRNEPRWVSPEPWGPGAPGFGGGKAV